MNKKLYVGGLPYASTEESLAQAFGEAGKVVSTKIIIDRLTGRSKGFGFVEMASESEAEAAIGMWDGVEFEGRKLTVNVAKPLEARR